MASSWMVSWAWRLVPTKSTEPPSAVVSRTMLYACCRALTVFCRSMIWMLLRSVKIYGFIAGCHLWVRCPKCTPLSRSAFMEMIVIQNSPLRLSSASFIPDRHRFPARPVWSGSVCDMRPDFGTRVKMHNISRQGRERRQVYHKAGGIVQDSPGFLEISASWVWRDIITIMNSEKLSTALSDLALGPVRFYERIDSTNSEAARWAETGAPDLALVVADEQTAGRGRQGR